MVSKDFTVSVRACSDVLASISEDSENLQAVAALAAMGILSDDDALVDAALSEILALPVERRHQLDPMRDITYLLVHHQLNQVSVSSLFMKHY